MGQADVARGPGLPLIEAQLLASDRTLLMIYPGLLARYERMDLLERLRDQVGRRDGIPAYGCCCRASIKP